MPQNCQFEKSGAGWRCPRCGVIRDQPVHRACPSWGLGDLIEVVAKPIAQAFGVNDKGCGCQSRKEWLNQLGVRESHLNSGDNANG